MTRARARVVPRPVTELNSGDIQPALGISLHVIDNVSIDSGRIGVDEALL